MSHLLSYLLNDGYPICYPVPTTRYAPALGSHFYPTLFAAAVCHSLDISIALTLGRIITELLRPALWTLLVIGDGGWSPQTILAQNRGG